LSRSNDKKSEPSKTNDGTSAAHVLLILKGTFVSDILQQAKAELKRLSSEKKRTTGENWKRWGPYLAERQWGTVREDYSSHGEPWDYFTHDDAVWRTYRWGEDGILGFTDRQCRLCFSMTMWNGEDPILKERLYGLGGPEGNHGEDVKEAYYYLDSTPTHSYMKGLYKYPQRKFPYDELRSANGNRSRLEREYELTDTDIFKDNKYFDVYIEYAKAKDEDLLIRITVANRGKEAASITMLPTFWFRNTWTHPNSIDGEIAKPEMKLNRDDTISAEHETLGDFRIQADVGPTGKAPKWLFTENETNTWRLEDRKSSKPSCKDAFHQYVVDGKQTALNTTPSGTKAGALYQVKVPGESEVTFQLRLTRDDLATKTPFGDGFTETLQQRIDEANAFYSFKVGAGLSEDERRVLRQAHAGLLWTKQFYCHAVGEWLDEVDRPLLQHHDHVRNEDWRHLYNRDIISMPDKWEYPWYAAWDLAFHMIPFMNLDLEFAKNQLILFLREWYLHPNGQMPAYEWNFSDVNPPVHAWACWRTYQMTGPPGQRDRTFLSRVFQKLLLNFTWWVNRKDVRGKHIFTGGFLGLDNIGVFDRSRAMEGNDHLEQADGTAWMAYYCSSMMSIAIELAYENEAYSDIASKFFEHYVSIAEAMNSLEGTGLWDEEDGFYYDHIYTDDGSIPLKIRSMVGIIPLFSVDVLYEKNMNRMPNFRRRMDWLFKRRGDLSEFMTFMEPNERVSSEKSDEGMWLLAIPTRERLERILRYVLDEDEFLSPYGVRSLSKFHLDHPFEVTIDGKKTEVQYVPGESDSFMFGGNSNWRGPIWFPLNYLLIEAFERYHQFYGDSLRVECPTGSGNYMNMQQVANEIRMRLVRLFLTDKEGTRPSYARNEDLVNDPHWKDLVLFYEYFHGDTGRGLGASHQTGWTALVAPILEHIARLRSQREMPDGL